MGRKLDDNAQVIVEISGAEEISNSRDTNGEVDIGAIEKQKSATDIEQVVILNQDPAGIRSRKKVSSFTGSLTIEIPKNNPITSQQDDDDIGRRSLAQSPSSEAKSRFIDKLSASASPSPKFTIPRTPLMGSPGQEDYDEDEEIYKKIRFKGHKKMKFLFFIEFSLFVCITLVLILSKSMVKLENIEIWSLKLWKWCLLALAIFCGRLFSEWFSELFSKFVFFLIENNFFLKRKVLYFVYSLQKRIRIFIWLGLILLAWGLLIDRGMDRSRHTAKVLNNITRGIASTLVAAGGWILKTLFVKILYSSFHIKRFFARIEEDIFHQYILRTLLGPPLMESLKFNNTIRSSSRCLTFEISTKEGRERKKKNIDVEKLKKLKPQVISAWTMKMLIKIVKSGFSTLPDPLDERVDYREQDKEKDKNITSEWEAKALAYAIFENVAKPGLQYIDELDLQRFMIKEETDIVFSSIAGGSEETRRIKKTSFSNWVVNMHNKHKFLLASLEDTKAALKELNKFLTGITVVVLIILWLILTGIATTEVLLFISSQFLLGIFSFGTSAKSTIEAIIFVFVKHPFDVGDRCVVDGVQVVVEELSILTTVFLRYDNEKIYYPNSLLTTKFISNLNRSPEMSDYIDFDLDISTSDDKILALKAKIKKYIDSKPHLWRPKHNFWVREIEDVNKMKMSLHVTHTINFQNYEETRHRRSKLLLKLKNIFQELGIKYHLLPLRSFNSATTATLLS